VRVSSLRRSICILAGVCLLAGVGLGFALGRWASASPEAPLEDPATKYVDKITERYGLTRDQRRLVWMIYIESLEEQSRYLRRQLAPNESKEEFKRIGHRANERILAVLDPQQRQRFTGDLAEAEQPK